MLVRLEFNESMENIKAQCEYELMESLMNDPCIPHDSEEEFNESIENIEAQCEINNSYDDEINNSYDEIRSNYKLECLEKELQDKNKSILKKDLLDVLNRVVPVLEEEKEKGISCSGVLIKILDIFDEYISGLINAIEDDEFAVKQYDKNVKKLLLLYDKIDTSECYYRSDIIHNILKIYQGKKDLYNSNKRIKRQREKQKLKDNID